MSTTPKKWSIDTTIKFLEAYEEYPCLWNHKLPSYKDRNRRDEALRKIVEVMSDVVSGFDLNAAKAKIRSIRNSYTLEHHKILVSYKSGTSADAIYKPTVGWFSVVDRFLKGRDTKTNLEPQDLQAKDGTQTNEDYGDEIRQIDLEGEEPILESHSVPSCASSTSNQPTPKASVKRKLLNNKKEPTYKKSTVSNVDSVAAAVSTLKEISDKAYEPQVTADEFGAFGKTVAAHLRKLPINAALESQSDILNYLVRKRLGFTAVLPNIVPPMQESSFVSLPDSSPATSSSPSCSYTTEEASTSNNLRPYVLQQQYTTTECPTADILHTAWDNINSELH